MSRTSRLPQSFPRTLRFRSAARRNPQKERWELVDRFGLVASGRTGRIWIRLRLLLLLLLLLLAKFSLPFLCFWQGSSFFSFFSASSAAEAAAAGLPLRIPEPLRRIPPYYASLLEASRLRATIKTLYRRYGASFSLKPKQPSVLSQCCTNGVMYGLYMSTNVVWDAHTNQSINKYINQSTSQSTNQSTNQSLQSRQD